MTYTAPTTFAVGDEFTASWQNTYIKANLDFLATPPSVRATASSTTAIANSTWTLIAFDGETWDWPTTAMHDNSTNNSRLVAPVAGKYQVTAFSAWTANATNARYLMLRKNSGGASGGGTVLSQNQGWGSAAVESINVLGNPDERNPSVSAAGVLSNVTSARADAAVFDDDEVPKNIRSDEARERLRDQMQESVHILVPGGWRLLIGTPHTHASIYDEHTAGGALTLKIPLLRHHVRYEADLASKQRAFPYNFPNVNRADLLVFLGPTRTGRLLVDGVDYKVDRGAVIFAQPPGQLVDIYAGSAWPERFDREEIAKRRRSCRTLNAWDSQYLLHAKPLHQQRLDPARVIPYDVQPTIVEANGEVRMMLGETRIIGAAAYWDCAVGKVRGDASAFSVVLTNERGQLFWHVCEALEGDIDNQCRRVREIVERLGLMGVRVETNGVGGFVPAHLRKALAGTECGVDEYPAPSDTTKDERILDALEAPLSGRYLWAHVDALDVFETQMRDWQPGVRGQKDDFIDSGAGAISQTPIRIGKIRGPVQHARPPDWRPDGGEYEIEIGE